MVATLILISMMHKSCFLNRQSPLSRLLAGDMHFHLVYEDQLAVMFARDTSLSFGQQ
ncbi:MAG: hypothetical protein ACRD3P_03520 [Terriglobales bacterium]